MLLLKQLQRKKNNLPTSFEGRRRFLSLFM